MSMFRMFVVIGAVALIGFFAWPWGSGGLSTGLLAGHISVQAGGVNTQIPMALGLFGTLGLAAMLLGLSTALFFTRSGG